MEKSFVKSVAVKTFQDQQLAQHSSRHLCDSHFFFRFVCISDTHGLTGGLKLPPGDVLIHAGDFSNVGAPKDIAGFVDFLNAQNFKHKVSK